MTWMNRTAEERRKHVGSFVAVTPTMKRATGILRRCYSSWHETQQASCSFLVGETGVGKTTVANDFLEEVREDYRGAIMDGQNLKLTDAAEYDRTMSVTFEKPGHGLVRPVVKLQVGKKTTYKQLFADTLNAIGIKPSGRPTLGEMQAMARHQIKEQSIRLIIFDDCQHIAESTLKGDPYEAADVFKALMKETRVQVMCMGLPHALDFLLANGQLETVKSEQWTMPPFPLDLDEKADLRRFLKSLSDDLPFDVNPNLHHKSTALRLFLASDGYLGGITKYVTEAVKVAIEEEMETITMLALAEAYRRKHDVPDGENPFFPKEDPNAEGFLRMKKERREESELKALEGHTIRRAKARKNGLKKRAS
ncbi:ATP-binding protein [Tardiphaga robiniae]|uniref:ATP-binding protein n=1 Tax=Tardiphaga robiniae TaxID=943830 RepID=UPI001586EA10|nr:ATP-binding protein [Tardiphaga robiniae]NUU44501.1 AAA family ATPase [Tardiphaga robiniae]